MIIWVRRVSIVGIGWRWLRTRKMVVLTLSSRRRIVGRDGTTRRVCQSFIRPLVTSVGPCVAAGTTYFSSSAYGYLAEISHSQEGISSGRVDVGRTSLMATLTRYRRPGLRYPFPTRGRQAHLIMRWSRPAFIAVAGVERRYRRWRTSPIVVESLIRPQHWPVFALAVVLPTFVGLSLVGQGNPISQG